MKKRTLALILFLALLISTLEVVANFGTVKAATTVTGIISSDTTWTQANSPYVFTGPVGVTENATLTIEAGVTVNFDEFYLLINGTLDARGSPVDKIQLISNGTSLWTFDSNGVIVFSSVSSSWDEQNQNGSIIENAVISTTQATHLVYMEGLASPKISNCTLRNLIDQRAIFVEGGSPIISNNTITDSNFGITLIGENHAYIADNIVSDCGVGIEIYAGNPIIERNLIADNTGSKNIGQGGIRIDGMGTTPLIRNNTIVRNSVGFNLIESPSPTILFNNIYNNTEYDIYLYSGSGSDINATYNWWGTTDTQAINQTIHDYYDDFTLGEVDFVPLLSEPNPTAPPDIPEFELWIIPQLFMIALLTTIVYLKSKQ